MHMLSADGPVDPFTDEFRPARDGQQCANVFLVLSFFMSPEIPD